MIDLKSPLLLNPDSIQAPYTVTGLQRGQGWRPIEGPEREHFPAVVRFLICDEQKAEIRVLGWGSIIGIIDQDWLIICTASHVLEDIDLSLGLKRRLSHLDTEEDRLNRRYDHAMLQYVRCGVWIPELGMEIICPIASTETSKVIRRRDTALVFVRLPPEAAGKAHAIPFDIGPPPMMHIPLFVAGFNLIRNNVQVAINSPGLTIPERHLILREGFLGAFRRCALNVDYDVANILIPIDGGMSGGPVIIYRPMSPFRIQPVIVAIVNSGLELSADSEVPETTEDSGIATPIVALFTHEVCLPDNTWIPFKEAVMRGMLTTFGTRAYHLAREGDGENT